MKQYWQGRVLDYDAQPSKRRKQQRERQTWPVMILRKEVFIATVT